MINLKIDPEFQNQIPPLTDDEFKQLEENILKEGKLISPLIVWGNTLVDGHNRYAILQKHPEIYFSTMPLRFENREEAIAWICRNQLGRRNLSPEQKRYLLGKQYEAEKKAAKIFRGNQYTLAKKSGGAHDDNHHSGKKTCDRIAEENGVSRASVLRASHYTRGIDIADNLSPGIKQKVFSGEVKFTNEEMSKLVQASVEHRSDVLAQILHPEALEVLESASAEFEPEKAEPVPMPTPQTEEFRCYQGPVVTDGLETYNGVLAEAKIPHAYCWAHARREFFKLEPHDPSVTPILNQIDELFRIERQAKSFEELKELRQSQSSQVIRGLKRILLEEFQKSREESQKRKAILYIEKRWPGFEMFLKDCRIPLSNNEAERTIRHAVVGRKNYYGSGSHTGADTAATLFTIIESCKKNDLDPRTYLTSVLKCLTESDEIETPLQHAKRIRQYR
jgi:hypothetical protein